MSDFHQLAEWATAESGEPLTLIGWSTGAGLAVLAAADENKKGYDGLVAISLGDTNILGWRWIDNLTYLTGRVPHEPRFQSHDYLPGIAPLPIFIIQSSGDQFIPNDEAEQPFIQTKRPKHFKLIHAHNHTFDGNRASFFEALQHGLEWVRKHR